MPAAVAVEAYVDLLVPVAAGEHDEQARRLWDMGADELQLYHFGLANERQAALFSELASRPT